MQLSDIRTLLAIDVPQSVMMATRSGEMKPSVVRGFGLVLSEDGKKASVLVPEAVRADFEANLTDNGKLAAVSVDMRDFTTVQLKGTCIAVRQADDDEAVFVRDMTKVASAYIVEGYGFEPSCWDDFVIQPALAVDFEVTDFFEQTPGPKAGEALQPK